MFLHNFSDVNNIGDFQFPSLDEESFLNGIHSQRKNLFIPMQILKELTPIEKKSGNICQGTWKFA